MVDDGRTDAALLAAAARGDDAAFAVLVRRYIRAATLLAAQFLGDRVEAEDIAQDAFVVVHQYARRFDANRPFAPWCFAIVRRLATKRRSRDLRRIRLLRLWTRPGGSEPAASRGEMALIAGVDADAARRAMRALSSMQRACFELVSVRGLSTEEVAAMHGISESTVRQHVFRARAALRRIWRDDHPDRWNELAERVAATALRESNQSGFDWLTRPRTTWVAASWALIVMLVSALLGFRQPSAPGGPGEWVQALAPTDEVGKALVLPDRAPAIGALLLGPGRRLQ